MEFISTGNASTPPPMSQPQAAPGDGPVARTYEPALSAAATAVRPYGTDTVEVPAPQSDLAALYTSWKESADLLDPVPHPPSPPVSERFALQLTPLTADDFLPEALQPAAPKERPAVMMYSAEDQALRMVPSSDVATKRRLKRRSTESPPAQEPAETGVVELPQAGLAERPQARGKQIITALRGVIHGSRLASPEKEAELVSEAVPMLMYPLHVDCEQTRLAEALLQTVRSGRLPFDAFAGHGIVDAVTGMLDAGGVAPETKATLIVPLFEAMTHGRLPADGDRLKRVLLAAKALLRSKKLSPAAGERLLEQFDGLAKTAMSVLSPVESDLFRKALKSLGMAWRGESPPADFPAPHGLVRTV